MCSFSKIAKSARSLHPTVQAVSHILSLFLRYNLTALWSDWLQLGWHSGSDNYWSEQCWSVLLCLQVRQATIGVKQCWSVCLCLQVRQATIGFKQCFSVRLCLQVRQATIGFKQCYTVRLCLQVRQATIGVKTLLASAPLPAGQTGSNWVGTVGQNITVLVRTLLVSAPLPCSCFIRGYSLTLYLYMIQ